MFVFFLGCGPLYNLDFHGVFMRVSPVFPAFRHEEVLLSPLATDPVALIKAFHGLKDASQQVQWDLAVGPVEETSEADTPPPPPPPESEELGAEDVEPAAWTDDEKARADGGEAVLGSWQGRQGLKMGVGVWIV